MLFFRVFNEVSYSRSFQNKRKQKLFVKYGYFKIVVCFMSGFYFVDSLKHLMEKKIRNHCTHLVHLRTLRSKTILHNIPRLNPFVIIIHFCIQKQTKSLDRDYLHYTLSIHYKFIILLLYPYNYFVGGMNT